ncbi:hypothetical protein CI109_106418 [Kwoniella shandongensis]|uniref:Uncharacterized protein n=1 Tax=Kwoniella shandongensis TaxID=1734106 RepID=A0A5M6C1G0_9TREE|nr:uncharacterized protein CI109_002601 [Kwoniella shandongensis]KAA5528844.1 hypothetical protein CI109_002601 [Kwoniella shandongensis]
MSQSQESTQQPSIDIRPTVLVTPLAPIEEGDGMIRPVLPSSSINGESSLEETNESAIAWTQQQLEENARRSNGTAEEGQMTPALSTLGDGVTAIPQPPAPQLEVAMEEEDNGRSTELPPANSESHLGPSWAVAPPSSSRPSTRPSTPRTEGDQLDESFPLDQEAEQAPNIEPEPELEPTEVEPPNVSSPETSSPPPLPTRAVQLGRTAQLTSTTSAPAMTNGRTSPFKNMSPISKFSPMKAGARVAIDGSHATSSANTSRPSRFGQKGKKNTQSDTSEEDSFVGKSTMPQRVRAPLERFNEVMKRHSTEQLGAVSNISDYGKRNEPDNEEAEDSQMQEQLNGNHNEETQERSESKEESKQEDGEEEEEDDELNWEASLRRDDSRSMGADDRDEPQSPTPALNGSFRLNARSPPSQRESISPDNRNRSAPQHPAQPAQPAGPGSPHVQHTRHFALSGSTTSSRLDNDAGALFSSQAISEEFRLMEETQADTQRSNIFQATQMVTRTLSSSRAGSSQQSPERQVEGLEPTQPDTLEDGSSQPAGHATEGNGAHNPVITASRSLASRQPSADSATTSVRTDVPLHRQLQRRARTEDQASAQFRFDVQGMHLAPIPGSSSPTHLQNHKSEQPRIPDRMTSPRNQTSPNRPSSEPPFPNDGLLQETYIDPPEPIAEIAMEASTSSQPQDRPITSPIEPVREYPGSEVAPEPVLPAAASQIDDPIPTHPTSSGAAFARETSSFPAPSPTSTPKRHTGRIRKAPRIYSPSSPDPIRLTPSRTARPASESDSSPEAEDEEDHTYRPAAGGSKKRTSMPNSRHSTTAAEGSKKAVSAKPAPVLVSSAARKRKRVIESSPPPAPAASDDESSSAPEDPEDNTYQPTQMPQVAQPPETNGKQRASTVDSRASSSRPPVKKVKLATKSRRPSSPLSSISSSTTKYDNRVLAAYQRHFYPATVVARTTKGFHVRYDDGDEKKDLLPDKMRQLVLRKGDQVESVNVENVPLRLEVAVDWDGGPRGVKCNHEGKSVGYIAMRNICIRTAVIQADFNDRLFDPTLFPLAGVPAPVADRLAPASRLSSVTRSPGKPKFKNTVAAPSPARSNIILRSVSPVKQGSSTIFQGMLFLITAVKESKELRNYVQKDHLTDLITEHGGTAVENWEDLIDLSSSSGKYRFKTGLAGAPFLVPTTLKPIMTSKFMIALAKGIPCLSASFVEDAVYSEEKVDWRSYLISSGSSAHTEQDMSQTVDLTWGEDGWSAEDAGHTRKPLKGKKVLFIQPRSLKYAYNKTIVPVCLYSLGVEELKVIPNTPVNEPVMRESKWDYLVVEDRETNGVPRVVAEDERGCNIHWLKQCLIMGAALRPSMDKE